MSTSPVVMRWDGEVMVPLARFDRLCNTQYVVGETYRLAESERRSRKSHNHYFAAIAQAAKNLPSADYPGRMRDPETLRKFALLRLGYRTERYVIAADLRQAERLSALCHTLDRFAFVVIDGCTVRVFTAESQSEESMGAERFQKTKQAVLDYLEDQLGADRGSLMTYAGHTG